MKVRVTTDELTDKHTLGIECLHHGGEGAAVDFHHAMQWLRDEAERTSANSAIKV